MLETALVTSGLHRYIDLVLSADQVRAFKTSPSVYALGPRALKLQPHQITFVSSNCWDACAAAWYGYTSFWVNRNDAVLERLGVKLNGTGTSLTDAAEFVLQEIHQSKGTVHMTETEDVLINAPMRPGFERVLTTEALELVAKLHRQFESRRQELLAKRVERAKRLDAGERPDFLAETKHVREGNWTIAPLPADLQCRRVEITGPVERKMVINALNSGADAYMTDFEDSNTPNWDNQITGQINLMQAIRRTISLQQGAKTLRAERQSRQSSSCGRAAGTSTRSMCWLTVSGCRARIFDFALYMFHNAKELIARGSGPYFYLPKLESHLEARLWNDIFVATQERTRHPARNDQGHGADRDDPGRVRNGRDPVRVARSLRRIERGALGLHLLVHQEVQGRQELRAGRSRKGDDDGAVHARVRAAAARHLSQAKRPGDGRHECADSDQERSGSKRSSDGRRAQR